MRQTLENIKTIIAETIGVIGGFFWAYKTGWDYEPLILIATSSTCFVISIILLTVKTNIINNDSNKPLENTQELNPISQINPNENFRYNESLHYTDITPEAIKTQIKGAPLFQQLEVANNFTGLNVQWSLRLFMIHKLPANQVSITMSAVDMMYPKISFVTNTEDYPILKIAEDEKLFTVSGKIIECKTYDITLELISLKAI